jgi:hypothetical protein
MIEFEHEYDKRVNLQLAQTEAAILQAAAQIYAARIMSNEVAERGNQQALKLSIKEAVVMANSIDELIKAEDEM